MARKPAKRTPQRSPRNNASDDGAAPESPSSDRDKIIAALMTLLAEMPFEEIGLPDIAAGAGVSLAELRGPHFDPHSIDVGQAAVHNARLARR